MNNSLEMTSATYQASICIYSKVLSAKEITNSLGIQPSRCHEKGSPWSKRKPEGRLRDASSWMLNNDTEEFASMEAHIEYVVSIIAIL